VILLFEIRFFSEMRRDCTSQGRDFAFERPGFAGSLAEAPARARVATVGAGRPSIRNFPSRKTESDAARGWRNWRHLPSCNSTSMPELLQ